MKTFLKLPLLAAAAAIPAALMVLGANAATNLLTNPNFDANTNGWSIKTGWPTGTIAWGAGSMKLTNTMAPTVTSSTAATECIDGLTPAATYTLKADAMVPSGQKRHGGAQTRVFWFDGAACTGKVLTTPQGSTFVTALDKWTTSKDDFVAPAGAKSAQVMLMTEMYKADPGEDSSAFFFALWDNASFTEAPAPVVVPSPTSTPTNVPTKTPTTVPTATTTPAGGNTVTPPSDPQSGNTNPVDDGNNQGGQDSNGGPDGHVTSTPNQVPGDPGSGEAVNSLGGTATTTPVVAKHSTESPLAPSTGSGQHNQGSSLIDWRIFLLGVLALMAVSGLAVTVGSVVRSGDDPEEF